MVAVLTRPLIHFFVLLLLSISIQAAPAAQKAASQPGRSSRSPSPSPHSRPPSPSENLVVSVVRTAIGNAGEHWAILIHQDGSNAGQRFHALSRKEKGKILAPESGAYTFASKPGGKEMNKILIGRLLDGKYIFDAEGAMKKVKLTEEYPKENCVDYVIRGLKQLAADGILDHAKVDAFMKQHPQEEIEEIRKKTAHQPTR